MVALKAFFEDSSSLSVVNQLVYDTLVLSLEATARPSEDVFNRICDFLPWIIEHGHKGEIIGLDVVVTLLDRYLPGLLPYLQDAPVIHVEPVPNAFPFDEFVLSKYQIQ